MVSDFKIFAPLLSSSYMIISEKINFKTISFSLSFISEFFKMYFLEDNDMCNICSSFVSFSVKESLTNSWMNQKNSMNNSPNVFKVIDIFSFLFSLDFFSIFLLFCSFISYLVSFNSSFSFIILLLLSILLFSSLFSFFLLSFYFHIHNQSSQFFLYE